MIIEEKEKVRLTEMSIGGVIYLVESKTSPSASESVENKVKRLILNHLENKKVI